MQSLRRSLLLSPAPHVGPHGATATPLITTPPTSVFAMSLLHKYPQLCNAPFADIARAWTTTVDAAIRAHVPLAEQQALNNAHSGDGVPHPSSTQSGTGKYYVSHWAALHGFTNVLHHLVKLESDAGASASSAHCHSSPPRVMTNSFAGLVPLHYAAKGGQLAALQLISSFCHKDVNGWPVTRGGNTVATLAAGFGHEHILRWLYGMGGAHRSQLWAHEVNDQGRTPLHAAAQSGALSVVQLFLDLPPSLNAAEPCVALVGTAALATTTTAGQLTVRDHFGRNLAHYAAESGRANVLQLLHDYASTPAVVSGATRKLCADILRGTDHRGATAVHYASRNPSASSGILPLLHEVVGLSLWELDRAGNAPAVWAVLGGKTKKHIECIGYMLARDRARTLATVTADGRRLLTLVRDKYGTEGAMFKELRSLGFSE